MKRVNFIVLCLFNIFVNAIPKTVLIIRHAEKTIDTEIVNFEKWHFNDSNPLSVNGWQRAYAYIPFFTMNSKMTQYGKIVGLFACEPDNFYKSVRPIQTLTPLSQYIKMNINSSYKINDNNDMLAMKNYIMQDKQFDKGCVLIAYEHQHIPELLKIFNVKSLPFKVWPNEVFDWVMVLQFDTKTGELKKFLKVREYLMAGDSSSSLFGKK